MANIPAFPMEWTIHGCSVKDKLGLPEAQNKTWLVDRSFWQSWEQKNTPQHVPPGKCSNRVCVEQEPVWGTEVTQDSLRKLLDTCFSEQTKTTYPKGDAPLRQCVLPRYDRPNHALEGVQLMFSKWYGRSMLALQAPCPDGQSTQRGLLRYTQE